MQEESKMKFLKWDDYEKLVRVIQKYNWQSTQEGINSQISPSDQYFLSNFFHAENLLYAYPIIYDSEIIPNALSPNNAVNPSLLNSHGMPLGAYLLNTSREERARLIMEHNNYKGIVIGDTRNSRCVLIWSPRGHWLLSANHFSTEAEYWEKQKSKNKTLQTNEVPSFSNRSPNEKEFLDILYWYRKGCLENPQGRQHWRALPLSTYFYRLVLCQYIGTRLNATACMLRDDSKLQKLLGCVGNLFEVGRYTVRIPNGQQENSPNLAQRAQELLGQDIPFIKDLAALCGYDFGTFKQILLLLGRGFLGGAFRKEFCFIKEDNETTEDQKKSRKKRTAANVVVIETAQKQITGIESSLAEMLANIFLDGQVAFSQFCRMNPAIKACIPEDHGDLIVKYNNSVERKRLLNSGGCIAVKYEADSFNIGNWANMALERYFGTSVVIALTLNLSDRHRQAVLREFARNLITGESVEIENADIAGYPKVKSAIQSDMLYVFVGPSAAKFGKELDLSERSYETIPLCGDWDVIRKPYPFEAFAVLMLSMFYAVDYYVFHGTGDIEQRNQEKGTQLEENSLANLSSDEQIDEFLTACCEVEVDKVQDILNKVSEDVLNQLRDCKGDGSGTENKLRRDLGITGLPASTYDDLFFTYFLWRRVNQLETGSSISENKEGDINRSIQINAFNEIERFSDYSNGFRGKPTIARQFTPKYAKLVDLGFSEKWKDSACDGSRTDQRVVYGIKIRPEAVEKLVDRYQTPTAPISTAEDQKALFEEKLARLISHVQNDIAITLGQQPKISQQ